MSAKTKDFILKVLFIVDAFWLFLGWNLCFFIDNSIIVGILWFGLSVLILVGVFLLAIHWEKELDTIPLKPQIVKAQELPLLFDSYHELLLFITTEMKKKSYFVVQDTVPKISADITFFMKHNALSDWVDCYVLFHCEEMQENTKEILDRYALRYVRSYYYGKSFRGADLTAIVWAENENQALHNFVDDHTKSTSSVLLPVAMVSSEGKMYLAKPTYKTLIFRYKKLRKRWLRLMQRSI